MSAEDGVHRDGDISGPSQVPSAKAPATVATSGVLFGMISMNGSDVTPFKVDISNMDKSDLLKALADDRIFSIALKDVNLCKCQVSIMRDPAANKKLAADRTNAALLEEDTRVNELVGEGKAATVKPGTNYAYVVVVTNLPRASTASAWMMRLNAAERLKQLILGYDGGFPIDDKVVDHIRRVFYKDMADVLQLNDGLAAIGLYERVVCLPTTNCKRFFRQQGYDVLADVSTNSKLFIVTKDTEKMLGKRLDDAELDSALHIAVVCGNLATKDSAEFECNAEVCEENDYPDTLMPFRVIRYGSYHFMLMPCYTITLHEMGRLTPSQADVLYRDILAALSWLHSKGLAFCDLKPMNVCSRGRRDFVVIDVGSVKPFGALGAAATMAFVPTDMQASTMVASADLDYWMLGMLIWDVIGNMDSAADEEISRPSTPTKADEKLKRADARPHIGYGISDMTRARLYHLLEEDANNGLLSRATWSDLSERLMMRIASEQLEEFKMRLKSYREETPASAMAMEGILQSRL